jgi:hypothetical protein
MGPVSLLAAINRCLALPPLLQWLARERNWVQTRGLVSRCVVDCVRSDMNGGGGGVPGLSSGGGNYRFGGDVMEMIRLPINTI